ncbi:N-myc-interactor [Thalassophryne amazonica]|uniref:N-myc-interactor n=1 Tax=Thalassophryne amazonica TaxID=390379 RepID=UPI001472123E|nr:N-myc-interactor [Thalassophryne amazonica]XP_034042668.1 N-myc-interactor [Thalassophryne amazonica]
MMLEKHEDEDQMKAEEHMYTCLKEQEESSKEFNESMASVQEEVFMAEKHNQHLLEKLRRCHAALEDKRAESMILNKKFKISAALPAMEVNFSRQTTEDDGDGDQFIQGVFAISQKPAVILKGGQALLTFEEEKVASQVLKIPKCSVLYEETQLDVKPKRVSVEPTVKFELHLSVSRKELIVSDIPSSMSVEQTKDRLHINFSRPSRGGGEVENIEYDQNTGTGHITFLHPGVAESLALRGRYTVDLQSPVSVHVGPVCKKQLRKFQTFCGVPKRTILLDEIRDFGDEEDLQDVLEIHFQKPSNYGGEIENIKYISKGKRLQAFFCEDKSEVHT